MFLPSIFFLRFRLYLCKFICEFSIDSCSFSCWRRPLVRLYFFWLIVNNQMWMFNWLWFVLIFFCWIDSDVKHFFDCLIVQGFDLICFCLIQMWIFNWFWFYFFCKPCHLIFFLLFLTSTLDNNWKDLIVVSRELLLILRVNIYLQNLVYFSFRDNTSRFQTQGVGGGWI